MAGFQGYADLDAALRAGQGDDVYFGRGATSDAGWWKSMWQTGASGQYPAVGVAPASSGGGTAYSGPTTGSLTFNNVSSKQRYLYSISVEQTNGNAGGVLMVYDRLVGIGAVSLTTATTLTLNTTALPRYTSGTGVQCWLECTTLVSAGTFTCSASYTNQAGTAGQATPSTTFATQSQTFTAVQLPIAAGDSGFQSVQSLTISAAPGTGVCNLILIKPLAYIVVPSFQSNSQISSIERDYVMDLTALPLINDGANLAFMSFGPMSAHILNGVLRTVYN